MFGLIGLVAMWAFLALGIYSIYVMYATPAAFSLGGFTISGALGGLLTLIWSGMNHIELIFTRVLQMDASWGEYSFVVGMCLCLAVFTWNSIVTHGAKVWQ
jgi:hypothetical protein